MSMNNHCCDEPNECPLCMEPLELDDLNFFPCTCGYQICRFCWHRIRTDENGLCPACRKPYPENPADFKPLSQEELQRIKQEKRQKDLLRKQKVTENRKHLANVRVVQKNLVFVVGLSSRLAEIEMLKKTEYFGKFGKIHKVVINHSTAYAGSQGPSASAYVTYQRAEDALKAIQAVNNIYLDGRTLKASLGTTKYCSHFMKNQQCPKSDCMYLHELGDEAASFTKEEMQQGKHQDFEKRLQEQYLGSSAATEKQNGLCPLITSIPVTQDCIAPVNGVAPSGTLTTSKKSKLVETSKPAVVVVSNTARGEGWPALSASPPTHKEHIKKSKKSEKHPEKTRQNPTDDQVKRSDKKEKRLHKDKSTVSHENRNTRSISGSQDSGNSSASATPPLLPIESITQPHSNFFKPSSPLPVNNVTPALPYDPDCNSSPIGTTPSSLSSCSEPSLSLQIAAISASPPESVSETFPEPTIYSPIPERTNDQQIVNKGLHSEREQLQAKMSHIPLNISNGVDNSANYDWMNQFGNHYAREPPSQWGAADYTSDVEDLSVIERQLDDELGFDPFEETSKALAEDIIIEQKLLEQQEQQKQRQLQLQQQQLHAQQKQLQSAQHQLHMQQLSQAQVLQSGIKNGLDYPMVQAKDLSTRLPPPGFNGMGVGNNFPVSHPQSHLPKLSQPFMGVMNQQQTMVNTNSPPPQQINGYVGPNKMPVPPGLANSLLNGHTTSNMQNHMPNGFHNHIPGTLLNYEQPFGVGLTPSLQHPNLKSNTDTLALKDLEPNMHSMRNINNILPMISSVNGMNAVNNMSTNGAANSHQQIHMPPQNPLANLLNFGPHHHPYSSQQNILQIASNSLSSHKGWWKEGGNTDLNALDPAIVSSGQLTDSRTESPPLWMKSVDHIGSDSHSWSNMLPCNLISSALSGNFNGIIPPQAQQRGSIWPPTSPPPGFNSISPLNSKQREAHNIEHL